MSSFAIKAKRSELSLPPGAEKYETGHRPRNPQTLTEMWLRTARAHQCGTFSSSTQQPLGLLVYPAVLGLDKGSGRQRSRTALLTPQSQSQSPCMSHPLTCSHSNEFIPRVTSELVQSKEQRQTNERSGDRLEATGRMRENLWKEESE